MNAELKSKWIAALQSGNYQQGRSFLRITSRDGEQFCCLGVLCEVAGVPRWKGDDNSYVFGPDELEDRGSGFIEGPLADGIDQRPLAALNDVGASFAVIADYIEKHIPTDKVSA